MSDIYFIKDHYNDIDLIINEDGSNLLALKKDLPLLTKNIILGKVPVSPGKRIKNIMCSYLGKNYFSLKTKDPYFNIYRGLIQTTTKDNSETTFLVFDIHSKKGPLNFLNPDYQKNTGYNKILVGFFYLNNSIFRMNKNGRILVNDCSKVEFI